MQNGATQACQKIRRPVGVCGGFSFASFERVFVVFEGFSKSLRLDKVSQPLRCFRIRIIGFASCFASRLSALGDAVRASSARESSRVCSRRTGSRPSSPGPPAPMTVADASLVGSGGGSARRPPKRRRPDAESSDDNDGEVARAVAAAVGPVAAELCQLRTQFKAKQATPADRFEAAFVWLERHANAKSRPLAKFAARRAVQAMGSDAEGELDAAVLEDADFYS